MYWDEDVIVYIGNHVKIHSENHVNDGLVGEVTEIIDTPKGCLVSVKTCDGEHLHCMERLELVDFAGEV